MSYFKGMSCRKFMTNDIPTTISLLSTCTSHKYTLDESRIKLITFFVRYLNKTLTTKNFQTKKQQVYLAEG